MIVLALALAAADVASPPPAGIAPARLTNSAGTPVHLTTVVPLDSRSVKQGQRFELRVADDVRAGGIIVIQRGTAAVGDIEAVSGKGMVGKPGRLVLRPLFVIVSGERVYLAGSADERGADATTGVAVGSLLLSPLGMFITGKSASLPAGTKIYARIRSDATVPLPHDPS
jgi:hypothetical protein